jgi:hypothetical protein
MSNLHPAVFRVLPARACVKDLVTVIYVSLVPSGQDNRYATHMSVACDPLLRDLMHSSIFHSQATLVGRPDRLTTDLAEVVLGHLDFDFHEQVRPRDVKRGRNCMKRAKRWIGSSRLEPSNHLH